MGYFFTAAPAKCSAAPYLGPCRSTLAEMDCAEAWPRGAIPHPRAGAAAERSYPMSEVRGGAREEQPHVQGMVATWAQEGQEELLQVQDQEGLQ